MAYDGSHPTLAPDSLPEWLRVKRLTPPSGPVDVVLDTDAYNEIDDQFAMAYLLSSRLRDRVQAIYAAPFHNAVSEGPADGMEKSYEEILRVLNRLGATGQLPVLRGSTRWMDAPDDAVESEAASDLAARAMKRKEDASPLYVLVIGAPTNVASALVHTPAIASRIVVVWLGGHPHTHHTAHDFNLAQNLHASRVLFDSGVPLVQIPCHDVSEHLRTTAAELDRYLRGRSAVADYLSDIYADHCPNRPGFSKVIWDISAVAWVLDPRMVETVLAPSPVLTDQFTWSHDARRHQIRVATQIDRDKVFAHMFDRLGAHA